jgi:hypothetical protein
MVDMPSYLSTIDGIPSVGNALVSTPTVDGRAMLKKRVEGFLEIL